MYIIYIVINIKQKTIFDALRNVGVVQLLYLQPYHAFLSQTENILR